MATIVLKSREGSLLSFLLVSGDDEILRSGGSRECIITGVPRDRELLDTPECQLLQNHKNEEWSVLVRVGREGHVFRVALPEAAIIVSLGLNGCGEWEVDGLGQHASGGQCELVAGAAG